MHTFKNNTSGNFGELNACCFENRGAWTFSTNERPLRNFGELITRCYMCRVGSSFIASPASDNIARECVLGSFYGVGFVRKTLLLIGTLDLMWDLMLCCLFVMTCTRHDKTYDDWLIEGGKNSY